MSVSIYRNEQNFVLLPNKLLFFYYFLRLIFFFVLHFFYNYLFGAREIQYFKPIQTREPYKATVTPHLTELYSFTRFWGQKHLQSSTRSIIRNVQCEDIKITKRINRKSIQFIQYTLQSINKKKSAPID